MVDVVMPQMGESLAEGTVTEWLHDPGDEVARDEPLLEIETDKVNTVVEAPVDGVLDNILVEEGQTVGVGTVLGRIEPAEGQQPAAATAAAGEDGQGHFGGAGDVETVSFRQDRTGAPDGAGEERSGFLSPAVRRLAEREGVSLATVASLEGSGRHGRVTRDDLQAHLEDREGRGAEPDQTAASGSAAAAGSTAVRDEQPPPEYRYESTGRDNPVAMSPTRRRIADHMWWSQRIAAQSTAHDEADVSALVDFVDRHRGDFQEEVGAPLTYTVAIAYATVQVLEQFPRLNAAVGDGEIIERPYVHLGLAVHLEDAGELIVPVVADADQLPFEVFARRLDDLVTRARERRLELRELQGGTFTYSNPGIIGGTSGTPILNQPQVGLLSTYAIRPRPWVVDGRVEPRPVMGASVTFDHRIVDGVMGFAFLRALLERLDDVESLLG